MFKNMTIRYFIIAYESDLENMDIAIPEYFEAPDIIEVIEQDFILAVELLGTISYERHTVHDNGCSQVCLTASLIGDG